MCKLMKVFCTACATWLPEYIDYCPSHDKRWTPWMPCYGPNVVFLFQTDHIKTVYNGLCEPHRKMKEEMEQEMERLARVLGESDLLGAKEEARERMEELEGLLWSVRVGDEEGGGNGSCERR